MTINTHVVQIFVASQPGNFASLHGGLAVQILPDISHLSRALKHQFAAFIRDKRMLVVWDDDPEKIIEHTVRLESLLMATIWNNGANYADEEKNLTLQNVDVVTEKMTALERLENGNGGDEPRRSQLLSPFIVACTLILIVGSLGLGYRKLAMEVSLTGNYTRLALIVVFPFLFFLGLVSPSLKSKAVYER
jgi:hypothetical protein